MEKKYTFAIDCDEVLRSLLGNMVSLYNESFGEHMKVSDVKDFMVENSFPKIEELTGRTASQWFFQDHSEELFAKSGAFPGIKKDIETLQKYGDVIIVTYQKSYKNKMDTLNWLEEHGIVPNGICFLKNKTLLHADVFIDDNPYNFVGCNSTYGILINAPYNIDEDVKDVLQSSNCKEIIRFPDLHSFCKYFVKNIDIYYNKCCSRQH